MSAHASTALASFMRAAESGSFAAAAKLLGISPAAVGQNVKRMEEQYGVKLFTRTTRSMSLTPEGQLLFQRARGPLRELDEIEALFDESKGVVSGALRLTAAKRFSVHALIPIVAEFQALHPGIEIDIDASDNVRDFVADPVDIAFRWGTSSDTTMIARKLADLPILTLAAPPYLSAHGTPSHPQDLKDHNCVLYRFPSSGEVWDNWPYVMDGELRRFKASGTLTANDPEVLLAAAESGAGIIQMDSFYAKESVRAGRLVPLMTDIDPMLQPLQICFFSREHMPLRVRAFIDFAVEKFPRDRFSLETICELARKRAH